MTLLLLYTNLLRAGLGIMAVVHIARKDYKPLLPAALVLALTLLPGLADRFLGFRLDPVGEFLYQSMLVMTVYLGSALKFYDRFAWWDMVVHLLSGVLFVSLGLGLAARMGGLRRFPALFFSFTLSLALHVLWELLEYLSDKFFRTDNQRWQRHHPDHNHLSEAAVQPAGLVDTMNDTIVCVAGTLAACLAWWFIL